MFHDNVENEKKTQEQLGAMQAQMADYESLKAKLTELEREKMTADEKLEADKKQTELNLAESRKILNKAKVDTDVEFSLFVSGCLFAKICM